MQTRLSSRQDTHQAVQARAAIVAALAMCMVPCTLAGWEKQATLPTGRDLHGLTMLPTGEAWAAGLSGVIIHSPDFGVTWTIQNSGTIQPLLDVHFTDALHGVAVGNVRLYSFDGGQTWDQSGGFPFGTIDAVDFADAETGWACGSFSIIIKTTDGGVTWDTQNVPPNVNLADIDFVDDQHGWAVGGDGKIVATVDGGQTWTLQDSGTTDGMGSVSFVNINEGWAGAAGPSPKLLHTTNAGATWQIIPLPFEVQPEGVFFLDELHGWSCGVYQQINVTDDGGLTWQGQLCPDGYPADLFCEYPMTAVRFADALRGVAVGVGGALFSTDDGGATWINRQSGSETWVNRIFALDHDHAWAANSGDVVLRTADGGAHWERSNTGLASSGAERTTAIEFLDPLVGYAAANVGDYIVKSADGGATWTPTNPGTGTPITDMDALDADNIVLCGAGFPNAFINVTHDGGETWAFAPVFPATAVGEYYSIRYITPQKVFAVAGQNAIAVSTNGGDTFTYDASTVVPGAGDLYAIATYGGTHVWIVELFADFTNGLARSTDGGETWTHHDLPEGVGGELWAVNENVLWTSGVDGKAARSLDGGLTWEVEVLNFPELTVSTVLHGVAFGDAEYGWVGGDSVTADGGLSDGVIYRRTRAGDLDGDGLVGAADLAQLLASWGECPPGGTCAADLDNDSTVGPADLATLLANWS